MDGYYGGGGGYGADGGGYGGYGGYGADGYGGDGGYAAYGGDGGYNTGGGGDMMGGMPAAAGGGGGEEMTSSQPTPSRAKLDNQSITSVTTKQLLGASSDHPDNEFHIDGRPMFKIRVCGCVTHAKVSNAYVELIVDDCTGSVKVKDWTMEPEKAALLREGIYVDIVGTWKKMKDSGLCLVAQRIDLVHDYDAVTHHMLDALYTHLLNTRGAPPKAAATATASAAAPVMGAASAATGYAAAGAGFNASSAAVPGMAAAGAGGMSAVQRAVLEQFQSVAGNPSGLDVRDVIKTLAQSGFSEANVRQAVDALATDGHLFNTLDEHHFAQSAAAEWE